MRKLNSVNFLMQTDDSTKQAIFDSVCEQRIQVGTYPMVMIPQLSFKLVYFRPFHPPLLVKALHQTRGPTEQQN